MANTTYNPNQPWVGNVNPAAYDTTVNSGFTLTTVESTAPTSPKNVPGTMNSADQQSRFGFFDPPLPNYGIDPIIDNALNQVKTGISPYDFRILDKWTGATHFNQQLPDGTVPTVDYIWTYMLDKTWKWAGASGVFTSPPNWAPPIPAAAYVTGSVVVSAHQVPPANSNPSSTQAGRSNKTTTNPNPGGRGGGMPTGAGNPNAPALPAANITTPSTATTNPLDGTSTSTSNSGNAANLPSIVDQIISLANGSNLGGTSDGVSVLLNWDGWSYYYTQVTNKVLPGPDTFGLSRNASNLVVVSGATMIDGVQFATSIGLMKPPQQSSNSSSGQTVSNNTSSSYDWMKVLVGGYQGKT